MNYTKCCETCFGEGQIVIFIDTTDNLNIEYERCEDCNGKGKIWVEEDDDQSKQMY